MLITKLSFYFEDTKKTGEKFREKFGFQNHHTAISSTQQVSRHDEGSIRPLSPWHIDPCSLFIPIQHWQGRQGCGICFLQHQN